MVTEAIERDQMLVPHDLDKYRGQWIAIQAGEVVASADTPTEVVRLVEERGLTGWVLDRVPEDPNTVYIL